MSRPGNHWSTRAAGIEPCEPRYLMSGGSPWEASLTGGGPDFVLDYTVTAQTGLRTPSRFDFDGMAPQSLPSAHLQSGLQQARAAYGLTGRGQTVAVIDSGIAYQHAALGGGLGSSFRVVGGWDFTAENDADPNDDGPRGSHGTHVAGIIGSSDTTNPGVAPGVDLVALRVFDDQGAGYFSWVENALRWVHTNRNAFRNPITTVNLSLGATWNSSSIPGWAMLEDELQQLRNDGIFVAVAAGNDFSSYNSPGLGYPAASPHVAPVAALDGNGRIASFSQRSDRSVAAPGVGIRSTVPDYAGNRNGRGDDFATYSGTSMASPYLAGAAVLLRSAMAFAGQTGINQDRILAVIRDTADWVFDPATNQSYRKLNLARAMDAVIPADDIGSTTSTARSLGTLDSGGRFTGSIGRVDDRDYFRFTAARSGSLVLTAAVGQELLPRWEIVGAGNTISVVEAGALSMEIVAGQSYTIGLGTRGGIGVYTVTASLETQTTDLGTIESRSLTGQLVAGERWYSLAAARTGTLTVEALGDVSGGNVELRLLNAARQVVASSTLASASRIDWAATAGERLYVQVIGSHANLDLRITNMLWRSGSTWLVQGTAGADDVTFTAGLEHVLTLNGARYTIAAAQLSLLSVDGGGGDDQVRFVGTAAPETAVFMPGSAALRGPNYQAAAFHCEQITIEAGGGGDTAWLYDSSLADTFFADPTSAVLSGSGFSNVALGFSRVNAYATAGYDVARFHDSAAADSYLAGPSYGAMVGPGYYNLALGFDATTGEARFGGYDTAMLFGSAGNDLLSATPGSSTFSGNGWSNTAIAFESASADANGGGWDMAYLFDSPGDDRYVAGPDAATLSGAGFTIHAKHFDLAVAYSSGGNDTADFSDGRYDDVFETDGPWAKLSGAGYYAWANGFDQVSASGEQGGGNTLIRRSVASYAFSQTGRWI